MTTPNEIKSKIKQKVFFSIVEKTVNHKISRKIVFNRFRKNIYKSLVKEGSKTSLRAVQIKRYQWSIATLKQILKNYDKGYISFPVAKKILRTLGPNFFLDSLANIKKIKNAFEKKYKIRPPGFIVVSPTQRCNLKCSGCYAASDAEKAASLPFDILDRILTENHDSFGSRFVTISGGEPLLYNSQGKNLLDIFKKYKDTYFIFYTNGTLMTKEIAEKLAKLGNASPQISAEGLEKETDERRGKGVFQRITKSMQYLREAGVPFVVSVTATSKNINTLLSDDFYKFWFDEQGATFLWMFHLMPIGRGKDVFELMPSPEERVKLYRKWEELLEKEYPMVDFWNSGVLTDGCIAYGRSERGYFYIDWNGHIMPCVFVPYHVDNVYDLYKNGKTLADALLSDFFKKGRDWQNKYGVADFKKAENWLMPCSIRDHYKYFRETILPANAKGEDNSAEDAKDSKEYFDGLVEYDKKLKDLTQPIWDNEYRKE